MAWLTASGPLDLGTPLYLGILNLTPDSFSDGGAFLDPRAALAQAERLVQDGARALDLGAESTRPGAASVGPEAEWARLEPALEALRAAHPRLPLSLDTRHAAVALRGLARGASVLNDVTGFACEGLRNLAQRSACGLIAMRSRREDEGFLMPEYGGPGRADAGEAVAELREVRDRLLGEGIAPERILLDPGFGFGTTYAEDQALWESLPRLPELLDWPAERICIAISRKRFVAWRLGQPDLPPRARDEATAALHAEAEALGYRVFRTHALPPPRVRRATPSDAPAIAAVQVASWRGAYRGILPEAFLEALDSAPLEARVRIDLESARGGSGLMVLERTRQTLGFSAWAPVPGECGTGELRALYLLPEAIGKGHGRRLMGESLRAMAGEGYASALLWVLARNGRARRFYEAGGWRMDGPARTAWQGGIALREVCYRRSLEAEG